ncbi:MAG: inositol monophosphatase family protein [Candidatus Nanopelagicales bacterium]
MSFIEEMNKLNLTDIELAKLLATSAGKLLLELRVGFSGDLVELRDAGDAKSQALIAELIAKHRPADAILSEEAIDDSNRLTADRVWIIDPLDGTWEYGEGRWDWAVHIALWQRTTNDITDAAIYLPALDQLFSTDQPPAIPPWPTDGPKIVVSRTRPPKQLDQIRSQIDQLLTAAGIEQRLELLEVGSAGAKTAALLTGTAQLYVHDGGLSEWDAAAPFAIAKASGITVKHADGSEIKYNQANVKLTSVYLASPEMTQHFEKIDW